MPCNLSRLRIRSPCFYRVFPPFYAPHVHSRALLGQWRLVLCFQSGCRDGNVMGFVECCQVQRVRLWANKLLVEAGDARSLVRDVWKG